MTIHFPIGTAEFSAQRPARRFATLGLLNAYSSRNLGDAAILTAIRQLSGERRVRVSLSDAHPVRIRGLAYVDDVASCDRFVSVGGDIFNNARPYMLTRSFVANVRRLRAVAERTIVFGQTIPSSCGWLGLPLLASALRRTQRVVVRDVESFDALGRLGVDVALSHDAAFALGPSEVGLASAARLFASQGLAPERTILLSVRSFDAIYPQDQERFCRSMVQLASHLADRGHQVAVLVQSDVNASDSDALIAGRLQHAEPRLRVVRFLDEDGVGDPVAALIGALTLARSVVAVRYHAAVLRMAGGRQPYHLYYSRKGRDLHRRHGLVGAALEDFDPVTAVAEIEALSDRPFQVEPIRREVCDAFARAYGRLA